MGRHHQVAIVLFSWALICWSSAAAQEQLGEEEATARARELFTEALELADRGDWERAVHRFRSAIEYRDAATIRFNLASSLGRLGRLTEALEQLDLVDSAADADAAVREGAVALRARMEPHIGRLRVDVTGDRNGTHVTVDGRLWDAVGELAPTDPGIRVVRLLRGSDELDTEEADIPDGGEAWITLDAALATLATGVGGDAPLPGPPTDGEGADDGLIWGLVIGAAALAIGAGILIGFLVVDQTGPMYSMGDFVPPLIRLD